MMLNLLRLPLFFALLACGTLLGCSNSDALPGSVAVPEPAGTTVSDDAGTPEVAAGEPSCEELPVAIVAEESDGHLSRLYVEAELRSKHVALLVDTGSATTFVEQARGTPDPTRHAADVMIGACLVPVDGRPYPVDETTGGLDVVGYLGADALLAARATEIDLAGKKIVRRVKIPLAPDIMAWPTVPIDIVSGHLIAHVVVDGLSLRLMVDTGSPHLLWVGRSGEAGDQEVATTDAVGSPLTLYLGTADLKLAGTITTRVPILRAPSFPYFEGTVKQLGGNIQGLLGLSALGRRRIVVDREARVLRVQ